MWSHHATVNSKNSKMIKYKEISNIINLDWKVFLKFSRYSNESFHIYFNDFEEILNLVHLKMKNLF